MRVWIASDLHLEFDHFDLPNDLRFDVAVFAGDIWRPIANSIRWLTVQRDGPLQGKPIILVPGNHEVYGHELWSSRAEGRRLADEAGIHLLDPGTVTIGGVRFVGSTLWTDYNLYGRSVASRRVAARAMNDHRRIKIFAAGKIRDFTPDDALALHLTDRAFIETQLAQPFAGRTVVITHHAPHPGSIPPQYRGDPLTPAFTSDLSSLITRYRPDIWIHGHDHYQHDYVVGSTRIVANPAGYPRVNGRENKFFDPYFTILV
ncbi:MAG: metallophosphoesterase [Novosphingobium sp.]|jgi:Icc-related predicted phosphoesterase|uniref:metallophosphoesterase n=1 Tax=Novosphingobium sp. TaxID=1874826 RepID=UPI0022BF2DA6|nr:metallophosphoesterase [Novosphingobium sp.]MCZ8036490.1 metallophosphoesterase [Novosphingobium sp.]